MNATDNLSLFFFNGHDVRVVMIDDAPWFLGLDVCDVLGIQNASNAYARLGEDQKSKVRRADVGGFHPGKDLIAVSESGLYDLVQHSDKPEARAFQDWVTRVVLPAIRKDGAYIMGEEKIATEEVSAKSIAGLWSQALSVARPHSRAMGEPRILLSIDGTSTISVKTSLHLSWTAATTAATSLPPGSCMLRLYLKNV